VEDKIIIYATAGRSTKLTYHADSNMVEIEQDFDGEYSHIFVTRNELLHYIYFLEREKIDDEKRNAYRIG
jgi:hypothetical protein